MWDAGCLDTQLNHVEERARDRLVRATRHYQEEISEEEAKEKVLHIMKHSENRDYEGIDPETNLKKYWIRDRLPESQNIWLRLCIVEDEDEKTRKIKTLYTNYDELSPNWKRE